MKVPCTTDFGVVSEINRVIKEMHELQVNKKRIYWSEWIEDKQLLIQPFSVAYIRAYI